MGPGAQGEMRALPGPGAQQAEYIVGQTGPKGELKVTPVRHGCGYGGRWKGTNISPLRQLVSWGTEGHNLVLEGQGGSISWLMWTEAYSGTLKQPHKHCKSSIETRQGTSRSQSWGRSRMSTRRVTATPEAASCYRQELSLFYVCTVPWKKGSQHTAKALKCHSTDGNNNGGDEWPTGNSCLLTHGIQLQKEAEGTEQGKVYWLLWSSCRSVLVGSASAFPGYKLGSFGFPHVATLNIQVTKKPMEMGEKEMNTGLEVA